MHGATIKVKNVYHLFCQELQFKCASILL